MCCLLFCAYSYAQADIYKSVDENGHITYSNIPSKNATKLNVGISTDVKPERSSKSTNKASSSPSPSDFPKVDSQTQAQRDDKRKEILKSELANEQQAWDESKQALKDAENQSVNKSSDKYIKLQADLSTHEKNVQLIQKELANLK